MKEETVQVTRSTITLIDPADDGGQSLLALIAWARAEERNDLDNGIGLKIGVQPDGTLYLEAGGVQISNVEFGIGDTLIFHGDRFEVVKPT